MVVATFDACVVVGLADDSFAPAGSPNWVVVKPHIQQHRTLRFAIDRGLCLFQHWCAAHGQMAAEFARALLNLLEDSGAVVLIDQVAALSADVEADLDSFGGPRNFDRYILRICFSSPDKVLVSQDHDFWDPNRRDVAGDQSATVAVYLRQKLSVNVRTLQQLVGELRASVTTRS